MTMRIVPAITGLAMLLPAAAWAAWTPGAPALANLAQGKPWWEVQADPDGAGALIHGVIDIDVPPAQVLANVLDCGQSMKITPILKSCKVTQRDPKGRWIVVEQMSQAGPLPKIHTVLKYDVDAPRGMTISRESGDMRIFEGAWVMEPLANGTRTRAVFWNRMSPGLPIPGPLFRMVVRSEAPKALVGLKTVSEAAAKQKAKP